MLYPVNNNKRIAISLNGIWDFQFVKDTYSPKEPLNSPIPMAVPSSYNDLFTSLIDKEYIGRVAYEKVIAVPISDEGEWRIRIGAAAHITRCFVDGKEVNYHNGGFLPIDFNVKNESFRLTVVMDNRLNYQTLPIATYSNKNDNETLDTHFDFFNYSGIHRNVYLYHLPSNPIRDIVIDTSVSTETHVSYKIDTCDSHCDVSIKSPDGSLIYTSSGKQNRVLIDNPILWDIGQGNLYRLCVSTTNDYYEESFGIRSIVVKGSNILLNGKPIYLKGFGMHEDHITIGKGNSTAANIRDFNLLQWIHANSFRTSHYPYDEEMYYLADKYGILIINEVPAVGMNFWNSTKVFSDDIVNDETKQVHMDQLTELIFRDKNHPSVIMYSLANEANTHEDGALNYFEDIFNHARTLTTLPLMIVEWVNANDNKVAHLADVIGLNRYIGWYVNLADLDTAEKKLIADLTSYYDKFKKPLIVTEFGADTIAGLHSLPAVAFSEEYQYDFIKLYQKVFDSLDFVQGEHVWNFADFMTKQGITRINGNKKGVFTRDRQPKMVAHLLRERWSKS